MRLALVCETLHLSGPPHTHQWKEDRNKVYLTRLLGVTIWNRLHRVTAGLLLHICKVLCVLHFLYSLVCGDVRTEDDLIPRSPSDFLLVFYSNVPISILLVVVLGIEFEPYPWPSALNNKCDTNHLHWAPTIRQPQKADENDADENWNHRAFSSRLMFAH